MVPSPDVAEIRSNERLSGKSRYPNVQQDCSGHVQEQIPIREGAFEDVHETVNEHEWEEESEGLEDRNRVISNELGTAVETACRTRTDVEFTFLQIYDDAPNPALKVVNLNTIGLPLSTRDAGAIRSKCTLYIKCEDGSLDVERHIHESDSLRWELDAGAVSFANKSHWGKFIERVVRDACLALGVDLETYKPHAKLHKLLLHEGGDREVSYAQEANVEGAFAMMAVVLPSEFDAGDVRLSYGRSWKTFRCCSSSQCDTAVITWFNGVKYEMVPLTSGYRLELLYALVHTTDLPKPALPEDDRLAEQFRKDLIRWNDSRGSSQALEKILYLLSSVYPSGTLTSSCLKGSDTIIAGVLEKEATQLGFCLGFAEISCQKDGDTLTVSNLVDFNGRRLAAELDFTLENTETIPRNLAKRIGSCGVTKIEGEDSQDPRRSVLVVWPSWNNVNVLYHGEDGFRRACQKIAASSGPQISAEDKALSRLVLDRFRTDRVLASRTLCHAARKWVTVGLWTSIVVACSTDLGIDAASVDEIANACGPGSGWPESVTCIYQAVQSMIANEKSQRRRLLFLIRLRSKCATSQATSWLCNELRAIERPQLLAGVVIILGAESFKANVVPYLVKDNLKPTGFLLDLVAELLTGHTCDGIRAYTAEADAVVPEVLHHVTSSIRPYELKKYPQNHRYGNDAIHKHMTKFLDLARRTADYCTQIRRVDLLGNLVRTVEKHSWNNSASCDTGLYAERETAVRFYVEEVMVPFIMHCASSKNGGSELGGIWPIPGFDDLQASAVQIILPHYAKADKARGTCCIGNLQMLRLIDASVVRGQSGLFMDTIVPRLQATPLAQQALHVVISNIHTQKARFGDAHRVRSVIHRFCRQYLRSFDHQHSIKSIFKALDLVAKTGNADLFSIITQIFMDVGMLCSEHVDSTVLPFMKRICLWAGSHGLQEPLSRSLQDFVSAWISTVLPPRPPRHPTYSIQIECISQWSCTCGRCSSTREFIVHSTNRSVTLARIGAQSRDHVVQQIKMFAKDLVRFSSIPTAQPGLELFKPEGVLKINRWEMGRAQGYALLSSISEGKKDQKRLLGEQYLRLLAALDLPSSLAPDTSLEPEQGIKRSADGQLDESHIPKKPKVYVSKSGP